MADEAVAELNELFGKGDKPLEPDVVAELQSILRLHQVPAQDLFYKWEEYGIKLDMNELQVTVETLRAFKQDLHDALERNNRAQAVKTEKRFGATPRTTAKGADVYGMLDGLATPGPGRSAKLSSRKKNLETPSVSRIKAEPPSSPLGARDSPSTPQATKAAPNSQAPSSFKDRKNAGEVTQVFNDKLEPAEPPIVPFGESRVKVTVESDYKKLSYKQLAMQVSEAANVLDERIESFQKRVMEHHGLDESAFGDPVAQSTSEMVAVGRIASDSPEGKLNAGSLVLEPSRRTSGGIRVPLNMRRARGAYQLFPGQIVAVRGKNSSGKEFVVDTLLDIPLLPLPGSAPDKLLGHRDRLRGGPDAMDSDADPPPLTIMYASGPYTADDNLDFEPLRALCSEAADNYVDALVLTGPFLDAEHPLIASGDFDLPEDARFDPDTATMTTVFKYLVAPAFSRLATVNPNVAIVLVSSVRDIIDKHVSWPQEALGLKKSDLRELGLPSTTKLVGNPITLALNEAITAVSSQDILWQLAHEEVVGGGKPADGNVFSRVSRYLVQQQHYFPLFPPTDRRKMPKTVLGGGVGGGSVGGGEGEREEEERLPVGAMLDTSYLKLAEMVDMRPDVMVLPSSLPPFVTVVDSVLVINPGLIYKRGVPGTYAKMTLYPPDLADVQGDREVQHRIFERARVEIVRV